MKCFPSWTDSANVMTVSAVKYKRLKDKFGTVAKEAVGATPSAEDGTPAPADGGEKPKKTKKAPARKSTPKKRKVNNDEDDDDGENTKVKAEKDDDVSPCLNLHIACTNSIEEYLGSRLEWLGMSPSECLSRCITSRKPQAKNGEYRWDQTGNSMKRCSGVDSANSGLSAEFKTHLTSSLLNVLVLIQISCDEIHSLHSLQQFGDRCGHRSRPTCVPLRDFHLAFTRFSPYTTPTLYGRVRALFQRHFQVGIALLPESIA